MQAAHSAGLPQQGRNRDAQVRCGPTPFQNPGQRLVCHQPVRPSSTVGCSLSSTLWRAPGGEWDPQPRRGAWGTREEDDVSEQKTGEGNQDNEPQGGERGGAVPSTAVEWTGVPAMAGESWGMGREGQGSTQTQ